MKNLKTKSIAQILKSYDFPHRFYVKYAVACTKTVSQYLTDERSLKALDLAERFGNGEDIPQKDLDAVYAATTASAFSAASAAASYAYAAYASYAATASAPYSAYAANAAYAAASKKKDFEANLKVMLLSMIETSFTRFELIMMRKV